jgi:hypothetical protein
MKLRRRFLQSTAAAGLAFACDAASEAAAASPQQDLVAGGGIVPPGSSLSIPTLTLGKHSVSRLILGANPFYGFSHFNRLFSRHMTEWATPERVIETLRSCRQYGINTWQFSHMPRPLSDLKEFRARGGDIQFLVLSHRELEEDPQVLKETAALGPLGIVHHGGTAERKRRAGKTGEIRDFLKRVRDSGVLVGLSTHDPDFLAEVQEQNWDIDFFMTSLYYLTRTPEEFRKLLGTRPLGEIYLPEDPPKMCAMMRKTPKPCLCYKVLAAGRLTDSPEQIDRAFQFVFDNIKPGDGMIIGMYPRYTDQVRDNAERVIRILRGKAAA